MTTPGVPCPCCQQAQEDIRVAVREALADPLGLVERLADKLEDYVIFENEHGNGQCSICDMVEDHKANCVLAEAVALPAEKEKA